MTHFIAQLDDKDFAEYANTRFAERKARPIPSFIQKPVYTAVLRSAKDVSVVDEFMAMYEETTIPEEKERLALMLSQVCQPDLVRKVLDYSISVSDTVQILSDSNRPIMVRQWLVASSEQDHT